MCERKTTGNVIDVNHIQRETPHLFKFLDQLINVTTKCDEIQWAENINKFDCDFYILP